MLRRARPLRQWMGGLAAQAPVLGGKTRREEAAMRINMEKQVIRGVVSPEALSGVVQHYNWGRYNRELRPDVYAELTKLPLRFQLHSFEALQQHCSRSAVGYAPPMGPADPYDTIAFHVHRDEDGHLPGVLQSLDAKKLLPVFRAAIRGIDGDVFRFEEELIKIFPTKKVFVRSDEVLLYNVHEDAVEILHHWLLGLGF